MTTFLKNLHGLAQGQLFNGGYFAPAAAAAIAAKEGTACKDAHAKSGSRNMPWPRLAAYR